ncbi:SDR family NAD(P)-dependent oxidoreductase [Novosphingobium sp. BL-52-GroH]|uniref:SDR family NAD(P)-dependent oxidoreductase n=1 Tax=Novosphingobium sp. BL-52-GroH TaxID=3349877 RepID=UPI00384E7AD7
MSSAEHCRTVIANAAEAYGTTDILVNNAAHQMTFESLEEIPDEYWDNNLATNIHAMFYLRRRRLPTRRKVAP